MKKLTKAQLTTKQELVTKLGAAHEALQDASQEFSDKLDDLWEELVQPRIDEYNEAIAEAEAFKSEITEAQEDYVSARSDKWHESDAASTYNDWASQWSELDFSDTDLAKPEFEGFSDENPAEALDNAQDEVDG